MILKIKDEMINLRDIVRIYHSDKTTYIKLTNETVCLYDADGILYAKIAKALDNYSKLIDVERY